MYKVSQGLALKMNGCCCHRTKVGKEKGGGGSGGGSDDSRGRDVGSLNESENIHWWHPVRWHFPVAAGSCVARWTVISGFSTLITPSELGGGFQWLIQQ